MGIVLWFTGLSGSGKTTLALLLHDALQEKDKTVCILDGDAVRGTHARKLGFSREDLRENNRIFIELAREKSELHDFVLVPKISPNREDREAARETLGKSFLEVFVDCPLPVCEDRDAKGLYKKARAGEIENFIGVSESSPYEEPEVPDIIVRTDRASCDECIATIVSELKMRAHL